MNLKKFVAAAAFAVATSPALAAVFQDFTVDETPYGGGLITADKINGAYSERITFDGVGGFVTNAYADFGQLLANEGTTIVPTQLSTAGGYGLYAVFSSVGTVGAIAPGITGFTGGTGTFTLYLDPNLDTSKTLGATGADPIGLGNTGDDIEVASSTDLIFGFGTLFAGVGGFFDLIFDNFTLTPEGEDYFIQPSPFYLRTNVDGDFDTFAVAGTQTVTGDVSAVFVIPEPTSLALLGLSMVGLGLTLRRRNA